MAPQMAERADIIRASIASCEEVLRKLEMLGRCEVGPERSTLELCAERVNAVRRFLLLEQGKEAYRQMRREER